MSGLYFSGVTISNIPSSGLPPRMSYLISGLHMNGFYQWLKYEKLTEWLTSINVLSVSNSPLSGLPLIVFPLLVAYLYIYVITFILLAYLRVLVEAYLYKCLTCVSGLLLSGLYYVSGGQHP